MLLIDKYLPIDVDSSSFHHELLKMLQIMSNDESIPHIIFYGNNGAGKKTLIKLFLEMLYDKEVNKLTNTEYTVVGSGNKTNNIIVKQSNYHIVIEPNNNNFDRYLVQDIIKEYARKVPLQIFSRKRVFKTVLINNIDNMSYFAQTSLRRTMEKFSGNCRFIMSCHTLSKVIDPLKSRCICTKIPLPSDAEIFRYIVHIDIKEKINIDLENITKIIKQADGNIKKALWFLEMYRAGLPYEVVYDEKIQEITDMLLKKDINQVHLIRAILYNLMITNIDCSKILFDISENLCKQKIKHKSKYFIRDCAAKTEHILCRSRREIISFDSFIISVMKILSG